jgi:general stress protein 26
MESMTIQELSKKMKGIDLCMLTTVSGEGVPESRPMSNNGEVDYNGTSYFFTDENAKMVQELRVNNNVGLSFIHPKIMGKTFIAVSGEAELITEKSEMEKHWTKDLETWFDDGLDTEGIVMIEVRAKHIKCWEDNQTSEVTLQ